jgi:hypothetical protein
MQLRPLTRSGAIMARDKDAKRDAREPEVDENVEVPESTSDTRNDRPNPPRTTTGVWTSPKFGSAGSGGAELEPGPERD